MRSRNAARSTRGIRHRGEGERSQWRHPSIGSAHRIAKRGNDLAALIIKQRLLPPRQRRRRRHKAAQTWPQRRESPLSPLYLIVHKKVPPPITDRESRLAISFVLALFSRSSSMRLSHSWRVVSAACAGGRGWQWQSPFRSCNAFIFGYGERSGTVGESEQEREREAILRGGERAIHFYY